MEHEIGNISIARIRQMNPSLKGINNDFVMDRSEHYIPENMNPIFKYPLRLDGIIISIREKGSAKVNINLREYDIEQKRSDYLRSRRYSTVHVITGHSFVTNVFNII